ncbi:uncharacterized protein LTR77_008584 [Saxophila tyrrhenica]|uniref:Uncharacterized protein n=1 Tax=Saxophila tyrrhenica TaxID=1690608 RepID=A0AAV9P596_9PEZI|nr:hypothetical protein LTR77_008584 [Saxophila tyrrhenica]
MSDNRPPDAVDREIALHQAKIQQLQHQREIQRQQQAAQEAAAAQAARQAAQQSYQQSHQQPAHLDTYMQEWVREAASKGLKPPPRRMVDVCAPDKKIVRLGNTNKFYFEDIDFFEDIEPGLAQPQASPAIPSQTLVPKSQQTLSSAASTAHTQLALRPAPAVAAGFPSNPTQSDRKSKLASLGPLSNAEPARDERLVAMGRGFAASRQSQQSTDPLPGGTAAAPAPSAQQFQDARRYGEGKPTNFPANTNQSLQAQQSQQSTPAKAFVWDARYSKGIDSAALEFKEHDKNQDVKACLVSCLWSVVA